MLFRSPFPLASFARRGRPETRSKEAATSELGCNFYSFIILIDDYDYGSTPFFHYVNASNVFSDRCLVTYAGSYACIYSFLLCAGVHSRRSRKDCDLPGLKDGDISSSECSVGIQVGF